MFLSCGLLVDSDLRYIPLLFSIIDFIFECCLLYFIKNIDVAFISKITIIIFGMEIIFPWSHTHNV